MDNFQLANKFVLHKTLCANCMKFQGPSFELKFAVAGYNYKNATIFYRNHPTPQ